MRSRPWRGDAAVEERRRRARTARRRWRCSSRPISRNWVNTSACSSASSRSLTNSSKRVSLPDRPAEPRAVAERVRRVVADLLEPGQRGEHQAAAAHAGGLLGVDEQLVDDLLVHARLLAGQRRPGDLLDLVGQIGQQRLVGLGAPQQERRRQPAQCRGGGVVVSFDGHCEPPAEAEQDAT